MFLAEPTLLHLDRDDSFSPPFAVMCLRWGEEKDRHWDLPRRVRVYGPPPRRFGVTVRRISSDSYSVALVWDETCLSWSLLGRSEILETSLVPLLRAMGTEVSYLLKQPVENEIPVLLDAA